MAGSGTTPAGSSAPPADAAGTWATCLHGGGAGLAGSQILTSFDCGEEPPGPTSTLRRRQRRPRDASRLARPVGGLVAIVAALLHLPGAAGHVQARGSCGSGLLGHPAQLRQWSRFGGSPATRSPRASAPSVLTALSSPTRPVVVGAPGEIPAWLRAGRQWRHLLCHIPRWRLCRSAPLPAGLLVTVDAGNRQGNPMAGIALVLSTSVTPTGATPLLGGGVDFSSNPVP